MAHDRPLGLTLAGGFMVLAVIGYSTGAISALLTGGMYPSVLGGTVRVDGLALFTGYAPLVPIAAVLAREILYERSFRTVLVGFAAWFVIACLDIVILGGIQMTLAIAFSGLVALVFVVAERNRFADVRAHA